jgi:hypothetical protein
MASESYRQKIISKYSPTENKKTSYIYFAKVKNKDMVKIGISKDPNKRKSTIQTNIPYNIKIINKIKCGHPRKLEKILHQYFAKYRKRGEWFKFNNKKIIELSNYNLHTLLDTLL